MNETASPPRGTFHGEEEDGSIKWHWPDQILVSPHLASSLSDLEILVELSGGHRLASALGIPDKQRYSDHLPVQAWLT